MSVDDADVSQRGAGERARRTPGWARASSRAGGVGERLESRSVEYSSINPNGRIPSLEEDGLVLWVRLFPAALAAASLELGGGRPSPEPG